jgi:phosphatidylserine/phosphatidylglycerophosphate/cardiolipin synthase-like enzyme
MAKAGAFVLTVLVAISLAAAVSSTAQAAPAHVGSYRPAEGVLFNVPYGHGRQKHRINNRIDNAISTTPKGATVMISMYSLSRPKTTRAIVQAFRRGVNVKVVVNDHQGTGAMRRLQRVLGTNTKSKSYIKVCDAGCRGTVPGSLHAKFVLFSRVASVKHVVMVTSGNLTYNGGAYQWNDLVTLVGRQRLYKEFAIVFNQLARDRGMKNPYRRYVEGPLSVEFFPNKVGATYDPIAKALQPVRCRGAKGGAGRRGRTVIRVAMWTWRGDRGARLARQLRALDNRGCFVEVVVGAPSTRVLRELRRKGRHHGIHVRDSRLQRHRDYGWKASHQKYVLISGHYGRDRSHWRVLTGSMNITPSSLRRGDEVVLQMADRALYRRYSQDNFQLMWDQYTKPMPNY